ncbi:GNAT family N-acetyltransferase [Parahaliea mediterranea]|uniref:GNAT family N-acetyltransferase n=1 Tax=Parahaliea mediterranea TaxID=651086 RepID=UPI0019D4D0FB|nr:GNAT family N-acetyltransferase [Parahaliea mediterranea]
MPPIQLETPRLLLRPPRPEDFPRFAEFAADPITMEHLGGVQSEADAWRSFCTLLGAWHMLPAAMFSVIEKSSNQWIGRIGPWTPLHWPVREVGWGLLRSAEGKGYGFEAAVASMDYAFDVLGWTRVDHLIADANVRSQALAERLGSRPGEETRMPGSLAAHPVRAWGQDRATWQAGAALRGARD